MLSTEAAGDLKTMMAERRMQKVDEKATKLALTLTLATVSPKATHGPAVSQKLRFKMPKAEGCLRQNSMVKGRGKRGC